MIVEQADRDAARKLLDVQTTRYASTGTFRTWDEACVAFARHRTEAISSILAEKERLYTLAKANNSLARMNGDHRDEWRTKAVVALERAEAAEAKLASILSPENVEKAALLDWLAEQPRLELSRHSPVYGDDDDQSVEWRVYERSGPINDREWEIVGRGDTPAKAIAAASAALASIGEGK